MKVNKIILWALLALCLTAPRTVLAQTTHVVTSSTLGQIFDKVNDGYKLGNAVSEGDVLDFQGVIEMGEDPDNILGHSIFINKKVTVKSSTGDAVIHLHYAGGTLINGYPGNSFVVNADGAGSTISDLSLENTQLWIYNTSNVTFSNMSMSVADEIVGSGVGHVAVRYCDNVTFDHCSFYTRNNGGSSCVVFTGTSNSTIKNTDIKGEGNIGNLLYFNVFNATDVPTGYEMVNGTMPKCNNNTVKDCIFTGKEGSSLSSGLSLYGEGNTIDHNTFIHCNVTTSFGGYVPKDLSGKNTYQNNTFTEGGSLTAQVYSAVENNTVAGTMSTGAYSVATYNQVGNTLTVSQEATVKDNTVSGLTVNGTNATVQNNTINGYVTFNSNKSNITFTGNMVHGTLTVKSGSNGNTITGNRIVSTDSYAITLKNDCSNNRIENNKLASNDKTGDAAVQSGTGEGHMIQNNTDIFDEVIEGSMTNATVKFYVSDTEPTAAPTGDEATQVNAGQWLIIEVTPNEGYWTYNEMLTLQLTGSISDAEAPRRVIHVPVHPTALSSNQADGKGYYYYQIPAECTDANGYKKVVFSGSVIPKIDLSTATIDATGKTITASADGWTATITFDDNSWTYDGTPQGPVIASFSITKVGAGYFDYVYSHHLGISNNEQTDAGNYNATLSAVATGCLKGTKTVPFSIVQKAGVISYEVTSVNKTFGDASFINGLQRYGDGDVTYSIAPSGVASINATTGEVTIIKTGTATITATVTDGTNFTYATKTATYTLNVNPKRVNDSDNASDKDSDINIDKTGVPTGGYTYDGNNHKPGITVKDGDTTISPDEYTVTIKDGDGNTVTDPTDAGDYTVVITDKDGGNYTVNGETTFTIKKATLTITADDASKVYDGTALTKNSYTNTPLATGDAIESVTITGSQTTVGNSNNVPSAAVIKNGSNVDVTANYNITYVNGTLEVTKKTVKDNPDTNNGEGAVSIVLADIPTEGYTYDGTDKTPTVTVKDGDNVIPSTEYTVTITNNTNAGTATVTITNKDGGNYEVSGTTTFTISPKAVTASVTAENKIYDGNTTATVTATVDTGVTGETLTISGLTGTFDNAEVGTGKTVTVNSSAAVVTAGANTKTSNYTITYPATTTANITVKEIVSPDDPTDPNYNAITLSIPTAGYTYDGTAKTPTVTVKDGSAVLTLDKDYTVNYSNNINAGTNATVTVTGKGNYTISGSRTFTINQATLTITANDQEKEVGADDPALTYTVSGLQGSDMEANTLTGALTRDAGDEVGSYAINQGTLSASSNYTIDFTAGTLTIYRTLALFSGSNEWATYVAQENLAVPAGIKAYIVTGANKSVVTQALTYIPKNVPILLQRTSMNTNSYKAVAGTGSDDVSGNLLVGSATAATDIQAYKDYVLYNDQFVLAGVSSVGAGKAYLPATALGNTAGAPRYLTICSEVTGVKEVNASLEVKDDSWYTLDGHQLNGKPAKKGLYIKNGVKVVIK